MSILLILYNILFIILYVPLGIAGFIIATLLRQNTHYFQRLGIGLPIYKYAWPSFWFHAASVGEVRSLKAVIKALRAKYPSYQIVISVMTENGYQIAREESGADFVLMLPIENRFALKRVLKSYHTAMFFITDTELWPNLITTVSAHAPLVMLNGRISDKTYRSYRRFSFIFRPLLKKFTGILAKSEGDAAKFQAITKETGNIIVGGNIKYNFEEQPLADMIDHRIKGRIAIAASTHNPEEEIFIRSAKQFADRFDYILIAPRHTRRSEEVALKAQRAGLSASLYSQKDTTTKFIVIDQFGLLEVFFRRADRIFIGGSLTPVGGHNIYEALQYLRVVAVGPYTFNFEELVPVAVKHKTAVVVNNQEELTDYFLKDLPDADFKGFFDELKNENANYIDKIMKCVETCIGS